MNIPRQAAPVMRGYRGKKAVQQILPSDICVGASVNSNHQVCVNTPFGSICVPISVPLPPGTSVQGCIDVCTVWPGIPVGACAVIKFNGQQIGRQCIGAC